MLPIKDYPSSGVFPLVTILFISFTVFIFGVEFLSPDLVAFINTYALVPENINFSEPITLGVLVSSMFVHAGLMHLISNMWFLGIFGDNVEAVLGKLRFVLFYLSGGVVAGLVQYAISRNSDIPILGASGAIAAVLGFYLVMFPHHVIKTVVPLFRVITTMDLPAQIIVGFWFVTQLFNGTASLFANIDMFSDTAWWAHIGGFVYGVLVGKIYMAYKQSPYG